MLTGELRSQVDRLWASLDGWLTEESNNPMKIKDHTSEYEN